MTGEEFQPSDETLFVISSFVVGCKLERERPDVSDMSVDILVGYIFDMTEDQKIQVIIDLLTLYCVEKYAE